MKVSTAKTLVLLSPEDEDLRKYCCWSGRYGHINIRINRVCIYLHRYIIARMGIIIEKGFVIDHINGLPIDNRRENLRVVTHQQNCANNESRGYYYNKRRKKWHALVSRNRNTVHLGYYKSEVEAKTAVDAFLENEGINKRFSSLKELKVN